MRKLLVFVLALIGVFSAMVGQGLASKGKILMVIAPDKFRDEELFIPKRIFEENGYEVVVASREKRQCVGMLGARVIPDITIDEIRPEDYVAMVLVGGVGAQTYFDDRMLQELSRMFYEQEKVVAAICLAPVILANAGLLEGKRATVWHSESRTISRRGARYTGEPVSKDGRVITGAGPFAAEEFARQILRELELLDQKGK